MPEYLELESGGIFLQLEDGDLLELNEGAVFVVGNVMAFTARTQALGWRTASAGIVSIRQGSVILATASSENTWSAELNSTWR